MTSSRRGRRRSFAHELRIVLMLTLTAMIGCGAAAEDGADGVVGGGGLGGAGGASVLDAVRAPGEDESDLNQVLAPPSNALTCTQNSQCSTGFCVDGFCCDMKCDNKCMACSAAKKGSGVDGACGSIKYDTDPDGECPTGRCDGKNSCKSYNGITCTSAAQCLSNYCVDGVCCNNICMGACQACSASKKNAPTNGVCGNIGSGLDPDNECNPGECNGSGACSAAQTKSANGSSCTSAAQCSSGYCADGVCCDSWCLGTCQACTAAKKGSGADGTCGNIKYDTDPDEECWGGSCDGQGVCKQYNGVWCSSATQCLSGYCVDGSCCGNICNNQCYACSEAKKGQGYDGVCGPIASGRDPENECSPGECNGTGICNQPQVPQANGSACVSGGQCSSGHCVDGVCCDTTCTGACSACTAAKKGSGVDGTCGVITAETDPDSECGGGRCDGKGACRYYNGASCTSTAQCFSNYCVDGVCCNSFCGGPCQACTAVKKGSGFDGVCGSIADTTDPDSECNPGECNGSGSCSVAQSTQANGAACTFAAQCESGYCIDGVCCDNACVGTCVACSAAKKGQGASGTCGFIANATDPDNECANADCSGGGACVLQSNLPNGSICLGPAQCASGNCVDGVCCDSACSGPCVACTAAKKGSGADGACGNIKYDTDPDDECYAGGCSGTGSCGYYNGLPCSTNSQCLSTYCVDGFCCNNHCGGTCYACSAAKKGGGADGACGLIAANTDPDSECTNGDCNGSGVCTVFVNNGGACSAGNQCVSGNCVDGVCCDTTCTGLCNACSAVKKGQGADGACGPIVTGTDPENECANSDCNGSSACTPPVYPNGNACTTEAQCTSGNCVDGFCCDSACTGTCQACSAAKKGSGADGACGLIAVATDPDNECTDSECNGSGACTTPGLLANGSACTANAQCTYGNCVDGVCCDSACSGSCQACSAAKKGQGANGVCGNIKFDTDPDEECWGGGCNGSGACGYYNAVACSASSQCLSNYCVDGVCCGNSCTAPCMACTSAKKGSGSDGVCGLIATATDPDDECAATTCDGTGACSSITCSSGAQCPSGYCWNGVCSGAVVQVVGGGEHACALLATGQVKCWGFNLYGNLGLGDTVTRGDQPGEMGSNLPYVDLGTGKTAVQIGSMNVVTCALRNDGSVVCWGDNYWGQLGRGDAVDLVGNNPGEMGDNLVPVNLGTGKTAKQIAVGAGHVCAILNDDTVKCWGHNGYGGLGLGDKVPRGKAPADLGDNLPVVNLGTGKTAKALSTGSYYTCAILNDDTVKCWGRNQFGRLGLGDTNDRGDNAGEMGDNLPVVNLGTGKTAVEVATGDRHTCARLNDNSVKCWGVNGSGELGLGDTATRGDGPNEMGNNLPAVNLGTGKTALQIAAAWSRSCAILNDHTMKCWGWAQGYYYITYRGDAPNEMGDFLSALELGTGKIPLKMNIPGGGPCAILNDGALKCWGTNHYGQLGLGDTETRGDQVGEMGDGLPAVSLF